MEVISSSGRRIALLNDDDITSDSKPRALARPAYRPLHFSASSASNSSIPPTPQLQRSDSSDSAWTGRTPSPTTPQQLSMEMLALNSHSKTRYGEPELYHSSHPYQHSLPPTIPSRSPPYDPVHDPSSSLAPLHKAQPFEFPIRPAPQPVQPVSHSSSSSISSASLSSSGISHSTNSTPNSSYRSRRAPVKSSKNTHPCPSASLYACNRYFTTSGHAARHAKIHSGEKNVQCPECPKTFARKDNMDQHRKTHRKATSSKEVKVSAALASTLADHPSSQLDDEESIEDDIKQQAKLRRQRKKDVREHFVRRNSPVSISGDSMVSEDSFDKRDRSLSTGTSLDLLANVASSMA